MMNSYVRGIFAWFMILILLAGLGDPTRSASATPGVIYDLTVSGDLVGTHTWSGNVHVIANTTVMSGATLNILPGTKVYMQAYQADYREPEKRIHFVVSGTLDAIGTAEAPIYFTSDAAVPANGDWLQIAINNSSHGHLAYVIQEFATTGLNLYNSTVEVQHSVFRWNNRSAIGTAGNVTFTMDYCQIYGNGDSGIGNADHSTATISHCEIHHNRGVGSFTIADASTTITESIFHHNAGSIGVGNFGSLRAYGINFHDEGCAINAQGDNPASMVVEIGVNSTYTDVSQQVCNGSKTDVADSFTAPASIDIGYPVDMSQDLGYIPGDQLLDRYLYVYPDDETRVIVSRLGYGGQDNGTAWDGSHVWVARGNWLYEYDPDGTLLTSFQVQGDPEGYGQPENFRGLTFDDEGFLWTADGYQDKVYKIDIDPAEGEDHVVFSYPAPNAGTGGVSGLEWDGDKVCMLSISDIATIHCYDKDGDFVSSLPLNFHVQGGLTLAEGYWWAPMFTKIYKFDRLGRVVGWIYTPAADPYDLAWDGEHLWIATTTFNSWNDEKIFEVQILDDHHRQVFLPLSMK